jgi:hypothetical protein
MVSPLLAGNTTTVAIVLHTVVIVVQTVAAVLHVALVGQKAPHVSRGGKTLRQNRKPRSLKTLRQASTTFAS